MQPPQTLTTRQATLWLSLYYTGSAILIVPATLSAFAKQDAWIAVLLALGLHFLVLLIFAPLGKLSGKAGIGEFLSALLGKPLGKIVLAFLLLTGPLPITVLNLRDLLDFTSNDILTRTPIEAIALLGLAVVMFGTFLGLRTLGRAAEVLFPIVVTLTMILLVSQLPSIQPRQILPIGEYGVKPIIAASVLLFGFPYMEPSIPWMISSNMEKPAQFGKALRISALISGAFFLLATTLTIMRAGPELTAQLNFPTYFMAKMISVGDFYQRLEALLSLLFFIMMFFRQSMLFYVNATGIADLFSVKDPRLLLIPIALFVMPFAFNAWHTPGELFELDETWPFLRMIFGVLLPLALLLVALWRRKRTRAAA
ncbi:endospore germination permease [Cohnella sp. GCM10027633]|uniref:GerAB/ArcD/ProY family transporter n=1 Tax=unclassified Cohnella TaxID=2636738 RepID=UPI003628F716